MDEDRYKNVGMTPTPTRRVDPHEQVEHDMTNHPPVDAGVVAQFEKLRRLAKAFAHEIVDTCPDSRERSLALTAAEQALMWSVAAVARYQ